MNWVRYDPRAWVGDDPQRKHRCVGEALPDDEGDEEGSSDGEPGDGRARPPRMPFGLVEAEDEAEDPDAAQGQPEDVLGEGARTLSGPRSGKASPPEEEGDDRDEHVDVQRPAPVEQVGERAAQNEARRRADAARRAERGECASPLVAVGEGRVEQREQRGGQKRAEGACDARAEARTAKEGAIPATRLETAKPVRPMWYARRMPRIAVSRPPKSTRPPKARV